MTELQGTVVAVQANFYQVALAADSQRQSLLCTRRSRLKKIGQKVMVGDKVLVEEADFIEGRGVVSAVFPRKTELERPPVANADQILLVFALAEPNLDPMALSQFLVKAESTQLQPRLCLNKTDLISEQQQQDWRERLQGWGYDPTFVSVFTGAGLTQLQQQFSQKITILAGLSGVGKSSLINTLIPQIDLRTGEVSGKLNRGRHTTRHVELFELPGGGLVADTPGFNQPDLDCEPQELAYYFPEARLRLTQGSCQFSDCLHRDEPNCVVRGDWERYEHYLRFLDKVLECQEARQNMPDEENSLKLKITDSGKRKYEPKLASKKYRRRSRRARHQELQELYEAEVDQLQQ
jgi:ribosome biogenesis GTPase